jgi:UDP-2,3-diacylglucosamine pyrophosphatase LpxH
MKKTESQYLPNQFSALASVRARIEHDFALLQELHPDVFRLALNEAEAIAWDTEFPQLVFPTLAVEKVKGVAKWHAHQRSIRRTDQFLALAA